MVGSPLPFPCSPELPARGKKLRRTSPPTGRGRVQSRRKMGPRHPEPTTARPQRAETETAPRICSGRFAQAMRAGFIAIVLAAAPAIAEPKLEYAGTFIWDRPESYFGGWSAIEVFV